MTPGQRRGPGRGPARREKADDFGLAWKRLFQYMDRYRAPFIAAVVVAKLTPPPSQEVLDEFEAAQNYEDPEEA